MFADKLIKLRREGLHRAIKDRQSAQGPRICIDGREFINFSSNDYLGLANHPAVLTASSKAVKEFGFGGGASRLLSGGTVLHESLEHKTAGFKGAEAALIFNSGYMANTGIIPSISEAGDVIFSDELNHASIIDGCRLSKAKTLVYRHKDVDHLNGLIKEESAKSADAQKRFIVVTDSVFSMDGDIAPLKEIFDVCTSHKSRISADSSFLLYIDDAHGTGVLGRGRGALAHFGIRPEPWIIQMGTFSKALGSFGAFAAGSKDVIEWLINTSRSFMFSTALPACAVSASMAALDLIEDNHYLVEKLKENQDMLSSALIDTGFIAVRTETPIIPLKPGSLRDTLKLSGALFEKDIYAPAIRPPSSREPMLRLTVTALHTENDIASLLHALKSSRF